MGERQEGSTLAECIAKEEGKKMGLRRCRLRQQKQRQRQGWWPAKNIAKE